MSKLVLKTVITHKNKSVIIILLAGLFMALYTLSGSFGHQNGIFLPMPVFEQAIPFWTWTIWIYIVLYPAYIVWSLLSYKIEPEMNKTVYGFILLTVISCTIFILFPVNYPREFYPLPLEQDLTTMIFKAMRMADKPSNCLPSLHVGICFLLAYGFFKENRKRFWISIFLSVLISLSTLTTKQHYIYDIVLGFLLPSLIYFCLTKFTQVKPK